MVCPRDRIATSLFSRWLSAVEVFVAGGCWYHDANETDDHRAGHEQAGRRSAACRGRSSTKRTTRCSRRWPSLCLLDRLGGRQEHDALPAAEAAFRREDREDRGGGRRRKDSSGRSRRMRSLRRSARRSRRCSRLRQAGGKRFCEAPRQGHGRNGADAYTGAEKIEVPHQSLQPGDPCPECEQGTVYETGRPGCWCGWWAKRRCRPRSTISRSCAAISAAWSSRPSRPKAWAGRSTTPTAGSMIALLKYGSGMPFNRAGRAARECGHSLAGLDPVGHRPGPGRACRAGLRRTDPASGPRRRGL